MVSKQIIEEIINKSIALKCMTVGEMHSLLDGWSQEEKDTLVKFGIGNDSDEVTKYHNLLENGDEDSIFKYERQIFDNLTKKQRENILEHLVGFDENMFTVDDDVGYPSDNRGDTEYFQEQKQEQQGYSDGFREAIRDSWTGGWYDELQDYILHKNLPTDWRSAHNSDIKYHSQVIMDYIKNSIGLQTDAVIFRGGHWDIGTRVGDMGETPTLTSTSFSHESAIEIGINQSTEEQIDRRYDITVYAPKGTKGAMVNAPSLSSNFPEHEYLLNKGQKYIVLDVNDDAKTASILLIND